MRLSFLLSIFLVVAVIACKGGHVTQQNNDGFVQRDTLAKADTKNAEQPPAQPTLISMGSIVRDTYRAQGVAAYVREGNVTVLSLSKFSIELVPGLRVVLASDTSAKSIVSIGSLSAGAGDQRYVVPTGTDLSRYNNVLFLGSDGKLFAHAVLS